MDHDEVKRGAEYVRQGLCKVVEQIEATAPCYPQKHVRALVADTICYLCEVNIGEVTTGSRVLATNLLQAIELMEKAGPTHREICDLLIEEIKQLNMYHLSMEGYNFEQKKISSRTRWRDYSEYIALQPSDVRP